MMSMMLTLFHLHLLLRLLLFLPLLNLMLLLLHIPLTLGPQGLLLCLVILMLLVLDAPVAPHGKYNRTGHSAVGGLLSWLLKQPLMLWKMLTLSALSLTQNSLSPLS